MTNLLRPVPQIPEEKSLDDTPAERFRKLEVCKSDGSPKNRHCETEDERATETTAKKCQSKFRAKRRRTDIKRPGWRRGGSAR